MPLRLVSRAGRVFSAETPAGVKRAEGSGAWDGLGLHGRVGAVSPAPFNYYRPTGGRAFLDALSQRLTSKQMSSCSGLAALDHANTKFSRGYSSTGVGMGVCARHEFVQPNGVGDLQCGEW